MLAHRFHVVAIELQGHGHTRDIDRPLTHKGLASDAGAPLDALRIEHATFVGYSMGGAVALQLALDRPELVNRLVFAGGAAFDAWLLPGARLGLRVVRPACARRNSLACGLLPGGARSARLYLTCGEGQ